MARHLSFSGTVGYCCDVRFPRTTREDARSAASLWCGEVDSVAHLGDSGSSVYDVRSADRGRFVLRLTRDRYRSMAETRAEVNFLAHLVAAGCRVNSPLATASGSHVERVTCADGIYCVSAVAHVPGRVACVEDGELDASAAAGWGEALGALHRAAMSFRPSGEDRRWHWRDEIFFRMADDLIPERCDHLHRGLGATIDAVTALPVSDASFGMVHGDHGPQNFHIDSSGNVTTFDFGNCCYQFFVSDVAIALGVLRRYAPTTIEARRADFLVGYRREMQLDAGLLEHEQLFAHLRLYYVYLARLHHYGPDPAQAERAAELTGLEARLAATAV
jgi:Ser/Thr protein kinase RdoA (MazF antagonist)